MKKIKHFFPTVVILLLSNCSIPNEITEEEKRIIVEEIQERVENYPEALKRKDLEWFHNFWSNEEDFVFAGDGLVSTDYDASITQLYLDVFPNLEEVLHFEISNGHVSVLSKDAASYVLNFDWGLIISGDTVQSRGSWIYVFKKSDDQWKVVHSAGTHNYY